MPYLSDLKCPLSGHYQKYNLSAVFKVLDILRENAYSISEDNIRNGVEQVVNQTGILGRWQVINEEPLTICDIGHNEDGITEITKQIRQMVFNKLHWIIGFVDDKDIVPMLKILPREAIYYFCKPDIPRGLNQDELQSMTFHYGLIGDAYPSVNAAYDAAKIATGKNDLIFIGGSTFVVAEVL